MNHEMTDPTPLDPVACRELAKIPCTRAMLACAFDPSGKLLAAGGMQPQVNLCRLAEKEDVIDWAGKVELTPLAGHKTWVCALQFSPTGDRLYAADYAGRLIARALPALADAPPLWEQSAHEGWIRALAVSPDGQTIATCGNDNRVKLFAAPDGRLVHELVGHDCHVYQVAFHPAGQRLVSGDLKGMLIDWDLADGRQVRQMKAENMYVQQSNLQLGGTRSIAFHADGTMLAAGGMSGFGSIGDGIGSLGICLFDWETGKQTQLLRATTDQRSFVNGIYFHPAGFTIGLAGGLDGGWLVFWKPGEEKSFHQLKLAQSGWALSMYPDLRHLAVAHHDQALRVYELAAAPPAPAAEAPAAATQ